MATSYIQFRSEFQRRPTWVYVLALVAIAAVSRLPQLLSPNLLLDGDECILGLMAKHVLEGREFPVFFYGQNYGLGIIEAPAGALSFFLLGIGALPLKLAMLALWVAGVVFYFLAFARPLGTARSFWITLLLVLMPAWAVSSMKAWSGYVTAFSITGALLYLLIQSEPVRSVSWVLAGCLTSIIYFAQPLWIPGVFPIVLFVLLSHRSVSAGISYLAGIAIVVAVISSIRTLPMAVAVESWTRPDVGNSDLVGSVPAVLKQIQVNFTGSYYLRSGIDPGPVTAIAAYLWFAILAAVLLFQIYRLVSRRYLLWSHLLCVSVLATILANWVLLEGRDARYMLPLNALVVFLAGVELFDLADRHRIPDPRRVASIACAIALGAVSMHEFGRYSFMWWKNPPGARSEARTMETLIQYVKANGATRAFSTNALLQWQIVFYSREAVLARWTAENDRYPPYVREVDKALENGETVAVVGYVGYTGGLESMVRDPSRVIDVDKKYFVYIGPDKELLMRARFRFPN